MRDTSYTGLFAAGKGTIPPFRGRIRARSLAMAAIVATSLAACEIDSTEPGAASFVKATVEGSVQAEYAGTGTFRILPPSADTRVPFSLFSRGTGASENQTFHFQGRQAPAEGTYAIQKLEMERDPLTGRYRVSEPAEGAFFALYEFREGDTLRVFAATSGVIQVTESKTAAAPRRITGTFQLTGVLTSVCTIVPGFPGNFLQCEAATDGGRIEVTGSFQARPLGGDNPGLIPYPG